MRRPTATATRGPEPRRHRSIWRSEAGRDEVLDSYRRTLAGSPTALQTRFVTTGDRRIHLVEAGSPGEPVLLLLHGSASNSATWLGDIPRWRRFFRVIAVDIPGHPGLSEGRPLAFSDGAAADWLDGLLDVLGVDEVRIVGMSLGGWAALDFASRRPDRALALSLVSPGGLAPTRASFVLKAVALSLMGRWGSDRIQRLVFGDVAVPESVLRFGRLVSRHYRPMMGSVPVLGDADIERLRMPVQFFGKARDALIRAGESADRLARLAPHAEVHLLDDPGHVILGETEAILGFLRAS